MTYLERVVQALEESKKGGDLLVGLRVLDQVYKRGETILELTDEEYAIAVDVLDTLLDVFRTIHDKMKEVNRMALVHIEDEKEEKKNEERRS